MGVSLNIFKSSFSVGCATQPEENSDRVPHAGLCSWTLVAFARTDRSKNEL